MPDDGNSPGLAELSRQVRDVLSRFESLVNKLETQFVSREVFKLYTDGLSREMDHLVKDVLRIEAGKKDGHTVIEAHIKEGDILLEKKMDERDATLEKRVEKLEQNITWIVRIVIAAVVVAVLAAIGITKAGGK